MVEKNEERIEPGGTVKPTTTFSSSEKLSTRAIIDKTSIDLQIY
jgi:hypothetical protein